MFGPLRSADFPRYPYHFLPCPASALPREEHGGESAWGGGSNPAERTSKKKQLAPRSALLPGGSSAHWIKPHQLAPATSIKQPVAQGQRLILRRSPPQGLWARNSGSMGPGARSTLSPRRQTGTRRK